MQAATYGDFTAHGKTMGQAMANLGRKLKRHKFKPDEIEIEVICHPEDTYPDGCFASGDDKADREMVAQILADLEWNDWAWCCVEVKATYHGIAESDFLFYCSYKSERDFVENSGYYDDMAALVTEAIKEKFAR